MGWDAVRLAAGGLVATLAWAGAQGLERGERFETAVREFRYRDVAVGMTLDEVRERVPCFLFRMDERVGVEVWVSDRVDPILPNRTGFCFAEGRLFQIELHWEPPHAVGRWEGVKSDLVNRFGLPEADGGVVELPGGDKMELYAWRFEAANRKVDLRRFAVRLPNRPESYKFVMLFADGEKARRMEPMLEKWDSRQLSIPAAPVIPEEGSEKAEKKKKKRPRDDE